MDADVTAGPALRIGRYAVYGEIASGGMATVHYGRLGGDAGFARTVAVKRLHPPYAKDPEFVAMFTDEARLAARVRHPNVVATLDVVARDGELFVVMDYVEGESLARLAKAAKDRGEPIPPRVAAAIVVGMLDGLHAAHEACDETGAPLEIVHRDVSPQNVLVGADGVARVLDFGVAKAATRVHATRDGQIKGKLAYMAPEQVRNERLDRRVDVFASGVVLWELLTGEDLFRRDSYAATLQAVVDLVVDAPSARRGPSVRAIDDVVLRALEREPQDRFATARQMAAELALATGGVASASEVAEWVRDLAGDALAVRARAVEALAREDAAPDTDVPVARDAVAPPARRSRRPAILAFCAGVTAAAALFVVAVRLQRGAEASDVKDAPPAAAWPAPAAASVSVASAPAESVATAAAAPASAPPTSAPSHAARVPPKKRACTVKSWVDESGVKHFYEDCPKR